MGFIFFSIYFYWLEANYFTILYWFLPYIDMNQPWIYSQWALIKVSVGLCPFLEVLKGDVCLLFSTSGGSLICWFVGPRHLQSQQLHHCNGTNLCFHHLSPYPILALLLPPCSTCRSFRLHRASPNHLGHFPYLKVS